MTDCGERLATFIAGDVRRHLSPGRTHLVGISGPQGSGKSTVVARMAELLGTAEALAPVLSLDDFYLSRGEREALAARIHPLLVTRGPPGTHDVALVERVLQELLEGHSARWPSFDKACDDRRPEAEWITFSGQAQFIVLEGWCLGARPVPAAELEEPLNDVEKSSDSDRRWRTYVNGALGAYQALFKRIDRLFLLRPPAFEIVADWREEQEEKLRAASQNRPGHQCMTPMEVQEFVQYYERITRQLIGDSGQSAVDVIINLDEQRNVRSIVEMDRLCSNT